MERIIIKLCHQSTISSTQVPLMSSFGSPSPSPSAHTNGGGRRARPQSMYVGAPSQAALAVQPTAPLNLRLRSRSTDRFGLGLGLSDAGTGAPIPPTTPTSGKFVDPLVARRQAKLEAQLRTGPPVPKALVGKKKVPVGELVAFFDQEKA